MIFLQSNFFSSGDQAWAILRRAEGEKDPVALHSAQCHLAGSSPIRLLELFYPWLVMLRILIGLKLFSYTVPFYAMSFG